MSEEIEEIEAEELPSEQEPVESISVDIGSMMEEVSKAIVHYLVETRHTKMWVRRIGFSFAVAFGCDKATDRWFVEQHLSEDMMQINSFIENRGVALDDDKEFYEASKNYSKFINK